MSDNVRITLDANATPPDGTVIATDDVGGVQYQIMKLATGADGEAELVTSSAPLYIALDASQVSIERQEVTTLLESILKELKVNNFLLNIMNDSNVSTEDV